MKLKLENKTAYSTKDLRAFLRAGLRAYGARSDKVVVVRYQRVVWRAVGQDGVAYGPSGRGQVGRPGREARHIWLHLPRDPAALSVGDLAHTLYHEVLHNRGARHRDMTPEQMRWDGTPAPWTEGLSIGLEPARPRPSREERAARLVEEREAHAREMLARAERRKKLADTVAKRWRKRVRYYERLAAKRSRT
jgi:hypothetical protein